jgi:hypothetical protein
MEQKESAAASRGLTRFKGAIRFDLVADDSTTTAGAGILGFVK